MRSLAGLLLHGGLLAIPWSISRDPASFWVLVAWVGASAFEGVHADESRSRIPVFEKRRALGLLVTLALCFAIPGSGSVIGVLAIVAGFGLRVWSVRALNGGFSVSMSPGQPLVTAGPYRWLRHPSEWGLWLAILGAVVGSGSVTGALAAASCVVVPSILRMSSENRAMRSATIPLRHPV